MSPVRSFLFSGFIVLGIATVACSGGGGGGSTPPVPTAAPTLRPTTAPTTVPTTVPTTKPTTVPTTGPSGQPTTVPTTVPTTAPTTVPTTVPTTKPTATPTPHPTPTATPTPSPTPTTAAITFNDYTTFGYDNQRDVYNPNSTALTVASLANLHLAWDANLEDYNTQSQPVLATEIPGHAGVLYVGAGSGTAYAFDATTGTQVWAEPTGSELYVCEGVSSDSYFGVGGTAAYDPSSQSVYFVGNQNQVANGVATNTLYKFNAASGVVQGHVNFGSTDGVSSLDFSHTAITLANGVAYAGTGATCDLSSWRGRVSAVNVGSMTLANTFYTVWDPNNARGQGAQPWGGGGVWGWGGVSLDYSGNVVFGVGNTNTGGSENGTITAPFTPAPEEYSGYGDSVLRVSSDLTTVQAVNHPIPIATFSGNAVDLDVNGTPVIFKPGALCDPEAAIQGKAGTLLFYDETNIGAGPIGQFQLSPSSYSDGFLGSPAYSPVTGLVYAAVPSSNGSLFPPGMVAINPGCTISGVGTDPTVAWDSTTFGPDAYSPGSVQGPGIPRSVPAVSAGGVVLVGTACVVSGNTCAATTASNYAKTRGHATKPLICCAPPNGTVGGALWALDASTGNLLNGGYPLIVTGGPIRMPPTIDGNWVFVMDNSGDLYGLTLDPSYPTVTEKFRPHSPRERDTLATPPKGR